MVTNKFIQSTEEVAMHLFSARYGDSFESGENSTCSILLETKMSERLSDRQACDHYSRDDPRGEAPNKDVSTLSFGTYSTLSHPTDSLSFKLQEADNSTDSMPIRWKTKIRF